MRTGARALRLVIGVALFTVGWAMWPTRAKSASPCTDDSRACVIATAQSYLAAITSHDASHIRLAPDVVRDENGIISAHNAAEMRHSLETNPIYQVITDLHDVQWIVEGGNAVAFYLIEASLAPGVPQHAATAHVSEWFHVKHGLITRIDLTVCFAGALRNDGRQSNSHAGLLTDLCLRDGPKGV